MRLLSRFWKILRGHMIRSHFLINIQILFLENKRQDRHFSSGFEISFRWLFNEQLILVEQQNPRGKIQPQSQRLSKLTQLTETWLTNFGPVLLSYGSRYSRMGQVKFVEDSLQKIWRNMVYFRKIIPLQIF